MRALSAPILGLLLGLLACSPKETTVPTKDPAGVASPATLASAAAPADPECQSVDDCTTTLFESGACCPGLCHPRALSKKGASAELKQQMQCQNLRACPVPLCRPPQGQSALACAAGRCVMQRAPGPPESQR